jgi:hypothetical protein
MRWRAGGKLQPLRGANKSSQVNNLPKAKSQAKDKRAKDRQNMRSFSIVMRDEGFKVG